MYVIYHIYDKIGPFRFLHNHSSEKKVKHHFHINMDTFQLKSDSLLKNLETFEDKLINFRVKTSVFQIEVDSDKVKIIFCRRKI